MKHSETLIYETLFKRFVLSILFLVTISVISGAVKYFKTYPVNYFLLVLIFLIFVSIAIVSIVPVSYTKKLVKIYFIFLLLVLFPMTIFYLSRGIAAALFWYIPIPVYIYTVYSHMKAIRWSLLCLVFVLLSFVSGFILRHMLYTDDFVHLHFKNLFYADVINSSSALLMVYICLYYLHKFHQLKMNQLTNAVKGDEQLSVKDTEKLLNKEDIEEEYKYNKIYNQIEEYFREKKPYLDPDFKIVQIAYELNINVVYIAKSIRLKKNMNFNNFVNDYRIETVKELIWDNSRKYTMKYIYLSSGFKNQSSFNKAFKLKEGITPSEYYKQNKSS